MTHTRLENTCGSERGQAGWGSPCEAQDGMFQPKLSPVSLRDRFSLTPPAPRLGSLICQDGFYHNKERFKATRLPDAPLIPANAALSEGTANESGAAKRKRWSFSCCLVSQEKLGAGCLHRQ